MMSELSDLYQEVILDHYRSPRNYRSMEKPDRTSEGYNPLCGDRLQVYVMIEDDRIADVSFTGAGCAISQASASVMTKILEGQDQGRVPGAVPAGFRPWSRGRKKPTWTRWGS